MPALYEIKFIPEGRVERFAGSGDNYYELDDGTQVDMHTTPAWCRRCGRLTHGEEIERAADIERQLEGTSRRRAEILASDDYPFDLGYSFSRDHLERLRRRLRWRITRRSPPRCITCGSTDIFIFPVFEPVPHPAGSGIIEVRCVGMCSTPFNNWFYTPEGVRIPRDSQPTDSSHEEPD